eukprot:235056_1
MPVKRELLLASNADTTNINYETKWIMWTNFCDLREIPYTSITTTIAADFVAFMYKYLRDMSGQYAGAILTAVSSTLLKHHDVEWTRPRYIRAMLEGFTRKRPAIARPKLPWSVYHSFAMFKWIIKRKDMSSFSKGLAILFGSIGLLRPNEIAVSTTNRPVLRGHIHFHPNFQQPTDVILTLYGRKTAQNTHKPIPITLGCHCNTKFGGLASHLICPVHLAQEYVTLRDSIHGNDPSLPFLLKNNGRIVNYENLRVWIKQCIGKLNDKLPFEMDPELYMPHSLRVGGCTDMVRDGEPQLD